MPKVRCTTLQWKDLHYCCTFYSYLSFLFFRDVMSVSSLNMFSVSSKKPGIKSETSGAMWHVDPESKIQLVNCELSPKFPLGHFLLPDIRAIYAYIFWSMLTFPLSHARLPFSFKRTCFRHFLFYFGGFGHFAIRWSLDPHLKHFRGIHSVRLLSESPAAQDFSFSCVILLKHFSEERLTPPQTLHFF